MVWMLTWPEWMLVIGLTSLIIWIVIYLTDTMLGIPEQEGEIDYDPDDTWFDVEDDGCHDHQHDTLNDDSGTDT